MFLMSPAKSVIGLIKMDHDKASPRCVETGQGQRTAHGGFPGPRAPPPTLCIFATPKGSIQVS
jgi:hypothetical protein